MRVPELWYEDRPGPSLLQPLGWLYGVAAAARRQAYRRGWLRSERVARPVVIVGNLTVGGTGKTPLTLWLCVQLRRLGRRPGILSRGYGRRSSEVRSVGVDADWREVGDEPLLLARRSGCPTVVAAQRAAGAQALIAQGVDVILCDDGLQHLRLARDCEIVVVDGARGLGNARLLPAGPLREPPSRLRHADLVVVNGAATHRSLSGIPMLRMDVRGSHALRLDGAAGPRELAAFRGGPVHAVAGMGNPARFFAMLRGAGLDLIEHPLADHHALVNADLAFGDTLPVLMTEKDAVKCSAFADARLWVVPVTAHLDGADETQLLQRVLGAIQAAEAARESN
ncbi:MAG: tetraacyldisaccharide 4'-kinase [Gammaproteobacteria bacterium]|nr:tetraacyldisaccharide 4'-kinase [Gammaproteobacteria bacterium]